MDLAPPTRRARVAVFADMAKDSSATICFSARLGRAHDLGPHFQHSTITVHLRASAARSALVLSLAKKPEPVS
jgi:hypothetical protein